MKPTKITPMMKQYLSIKEGYPDAILFYRMGDFYEMFFEDAKVASRILEITLTSRNKNDNIPIPMCGVPYRAARGYIATLIKNGFKVAICDQVEDAANAKGLVKRDVVRVITPGMIVEDEFLDEKTNNYILSIAYGNDIFGMACLDISTGTFRLTESKDIASITDEIHRISPKEILLPDNAKQDLKTASIIEALTEKTIGYLEDTLFEYGKCREKLIHHFNTLSLEGFGCEDLRYGIRAAGALLHYVGETQKQQLTHLSGIETYSLTNFLQIDDTSCRNLELIQNLRTGSRKGTLLDIIDRTVTAMGGRLIKNWLRYPLRDHETICRRLDAVQDAANHMRISQDIREFLKSLYDLQRINSKISMGHCNARDLLALKTSFQLLPNIKTLLETYESDLFRWRINTDPLNELSDLVERAIREDAPPTVNEGGIIKRGFNAELDELIEISRDGKNWLVKLEAEQREATGINSLKVRYNKVFGYYIEIPKTHSNSVPPHYIRKQTLVNAERYITEELKTFETKVLTAEEKRVAIEYRLFNEIRNAVIRHSLIIQNVADYLANVDCLLGLADVADQNDYHRPEINTEGQICIEDGRHPVIEKMITGERFVPNSIVMDNENNQVLVITGPNMAGKSTILRQTALTVLLTQMGSFVPAKKASIGITDRIFTRVGALDNLSSGQSTFMVEMQETANILNNATLDSLVIMDEIGRGTSTFDGLSIAWAVAEYLHDLNERGVKTLFATHYHNLTDLSQIKPRVKNYNIAVKEWNDEIIFLRKLVEGGTSRSYGIQVARLAGIPEKVITCAKTMLFHIENEENSLRNLTLVNEEEGEKGEKGKTQTHSQLPLFEKPENLILKRIRNLDISTMTPIDALNYLNDLKEKTKS